MTRLILKLFVKDDGTKMTASKRHKYGTVAGATGIVTNALLFLMKIITGLLIGSIAVIADAINNLSDSSSSLVTLVGFKMSAKPADAQHPYGHARSEYIAGFIVSIAILFIGIQLLITSVSKTWSPSPIERNIVSIAILVISVLLKLWQCMFYRKVAKMIQSSALMATATDSRNDVITTGAILLSILFTYFTRINIDAYMGILVAIFVIYSGLRTVIETLNPLLGTAPDENLIKAIGSRVRSYKGVIGFHDLVVHSYGPDECFASVHVEVPNTTDIMISHDLIDNIERELSKELDLHLVIHLDPIVVDDVLTNELRSSVKKIVSQIDPILTIHDFRFVAGTTHSNLIFDVTVPPSYKISDNDLCEMICEKVKELSTSYFAVITIDRSYSSTNHSM